MRCGKRQKSNTGLIIDLENIFNQVITGDATSEVVILSNCSMREIVITGIGVLGRLVTAWGETGDGTGTGTGVKVS